MTLFMKTILPALLIIGTQNAAYGNEPAEVMLFGVFHFSSPGLDTVKTRHVDVMTAENQQYLNALAQRISKFEPTVVLLEFNPEQQSEMQDRFQSYLSDDYELPVNEIYQLGFRIAGLSDVETIFSFDEREIGWDADPLFEYMPEHDKPAQHAFDALITRVTQEQQDAHDTMSLAQLLMRTNDTEQDRLNKSLYLLTNPVGAGDNFVGADAAASWWHRNFRMYAKIQKHAQPGERVLVIGGQGHIAILRDLLASDLDRVAADIVPYL